MSQSTSAESNGKEPVQGITRISVRGFKSLYQESSIEIRPLTILAGANSSGKSSIMQPLLLMKQTLEATYDPGALLLNGPNVQFTLARQFLSNLSEESQLSSFSLKIEVNNIYFLQTTFRKQFDKTIEIIETDYQDKEGNIKLSPLMTNEEIFSQVPKEIQTLYTADNDNNSYRWSVYRLRCFLVFSHYENNSLEVSLPIFNPSWLYSTNIRKLIHLPGLRGNPERTYPLTAIGNEFPGTFENYVASVVNHWKSIEDQRIKDLEKALMTLGLTSRIDARQVNDVQIELRVNRLPASNDISDMVSIADVGIGVSQVLPVLVALLVAEPGQLVYLEQPEIHLHPRAQVGLAEVLANAANRGVRVVLETHSELLLLAIQSLVAEGKFSPEKVKLHWFTRREDGVTTISSADLDETGAFGDWPEDFGDVSMKLESRYLDAAESRLWKRSHGG